MDRNTALADTIRYESFLTDENVTQATSGNRGILIDMTEDVTKGRIDENKITDAAVQHSLRHLKTCERRLQSAYVDLTEEEENLDLLMEQRDRWRELSLLGFVLPQPPFIGFLIQSHYLGYQYQLKLVSSQENIYLQIVDKIFNFTR